MDELGHWRLFLNSGSVLDYLDYRRAKEALDTGADTVKREETDEIPNGRSDYKGTEYR